MSTSSRTRAEESAEKVVVTDPRDPRVRGEEAEELPALPEEREETSSLRLTNLLRPPPDQFVNLSFDRATNFIKTDSYFI